MKIKKIKSQGEFIYPATIAAAIKDANFQKDGSAMTQGEINKDLSDNKANKSDIPTKVSDLTNDSGYTTKTDVTNAVSGKADKSHTHTKSDITDFPVIPTKTSQLNNDSDYATTEFVQNAIAKRNIAEQDTNASVTLSPNKHIDITFGEELILTLEAPTDTSIVNLYTCTILAQNGGTLTLTNTINWGDDEPVIEQNTFNEISIRAISDRDGNVSYYGIFHTWSL